MNAQTRISELTIEEFKELLHQSLDEIVREAVQEAMQTQPIKAESLRTPLNIPVLDIPWHPGLAVISREEMYGDDGR